MVMAGDWRRQTKINKGMAAAEGLWLLTDADAAITSN
jgi:hypothetical protein